MSERPKVQLSKSCVGESPPWVQIPPVPPIIIRLHGSVCAVSGFFTTCILCQTPLKPHNFSGSLAVQALSNTVQILVEQVGVSI